MNYENMTLAELEAENNRLGAEKEAIREQQISIKKLMDKRIGEQHATNVLAGISTEVLAEVLKGRADVGGVQ